MPTYEYQCEKCKKVFEAVQSMKDAAFETCPESHCLRKTWGKGKVKRLLGTGAGLIFKGSGFYITDYRSENYKQGAKKDSAGTGSDSGSTSTSGTGSTEKSAKPAPAASPAKPATPAPKTAKKP